jgi:hypothetical protein
MTTPANTLPDDISSLKRIIAHQIESIQKIEEEARLCRES